MSEKPVDLEGPKQPTGAYDEPETELVETTRVSCDGGMTHPRVWLQIPEERGWVECGYCDKRFVLKDGADAH
ncbi:zinc-finger domain-containing protein [Palleronia sp. LCG004]|uniref:zinc-finger domain-containing protein n=1 Tax=Palleronia sp. LCG004 TaxID=3079304 RepID=UPI0029437EAA|nr:zinc-finger domain-containing protein [Palleronia sp. LCG004]WOI57092.1 zinc-finger domain-containing protein [Palleronia sp. LCG004]